MKRKFLQIIAIILVISTAIGAIGAFYFLPLRIARAEDLRLIISTDRSSYSSNTSTIIVEVSLENVNNQAVLVQRRFDIASFLDLKLTTPNGTVYYEHISAQYIDDKIPLWPGGRLSTNVDLRKIEFFDSQNNRFNWRVGTYTLQFRYRLTDPDVYSNTCVFEII